MASGDIGYAKYIGVVFVAASGLLAFIALISSGDNGRGSKTISSLALHATSIFYNSAEVQPFTLSSSVFNSGDYLPDEYTCLSSDGGGVSPPLQWTNVPDGTEEFVITMTSRHSLETCTRFEWTLSQVPSSASSLDADPDIGTLGGSYPGVAKYEYAPPCSSGMGDKTYTFTIYAVSTKVSSLLKIGMATGPSIVNAVTKGGYVLGSASMTALFNHGIPPKPLRRLSSGGVSAVTESDLVPEPLVGRATEDEDDDGNTDDEDCIM
jgi:phosphatidylethanolamine-binding protein (PEBP) family uncharacterized protein